MICRCRKFILTPKNKTLPPDSPVWTLKEAKKSTQAIVCKNFAAKTLTEVCRACFQENTGEVQQ